MNVDHKLLEVNDLRTEFKTSKGLLTAVNDVSFHLNRKETVCIVGESGCGKSMTLLSILKLLSENGVISNGSINLKGRDLVTLSDKEMRKIRGKEISMIFQEPMTALNPLFTVGFQIMEVIRNHKRVSKRKAFERGVELLGQVGIPSPNQRMKQYPHELSGGMRQRVMIAIALANHPDLLIADEPTTALDVTIQSQILDLLQEMKDRFDMGVLLVTHDMGVVAEVADRVIVMYAGKIIEEGTVEEILNSPQHPYTEGLLKSVPDVDDPNAKLEPIPGSLPSLDDAISGCRFHPRCKYAEDICKREIPNHYKKTDSHFVRCWLLDEKMATEREQKLVQ